MTKNQIIKELQKSVIAYKKGDFVTAFTIKTKVYKYMVDNELTNAYNNNFQNLLKTACKKENANFGAYNLEIFKQAKKENVW